MSTPQVIPWNQYAVLAYIVREVGGKTTLGKTALQKIVYLLQEIGRVPIGYQYFFYHHGPYSADLAGDIDFVSTLGGINVSYDSFINMYSITEGSKIDMLLGKGSDFLKAYKDKIDRVISDFKGKKAKDLELLSTIVYSVGMAQGESSLSEKELIGQVSALKPKFNNVQIEEALAALRGKGYFEKSTA